MSTVQTVQHVEDDEEPLLEITPPQSSSSSPISSPNSTRRPILISVFFLLGVGSLVPWNFLITPKDYWLEKLRSSNQTSSDDLNELQKFWESSLSIAAMLPNTIFASLTCFGWLRGSVKTRILVALMVIVMCLVFNNVFVYINTNSQLQSIFFISTLLSVVVINSAGAVLMTSISGLCAMFGEDFMNANLIGQAIAGIMAASGNIVSLYAIENVKTSAFIFFDLAIFIVIVCAISFRWLIGTNEYKTVAENLEHLENIEDLEDLIDDLGDAENFSENLTEKIEAGEIASSNLNLETIKSCFKLIPHSCFQITFTFFITIALFPAVSSDIKPNSRENCKLWKPIFVFLFFNIADCVGRLLASKFSLVNYSSASKHVQLTMMSIFRLIFLILIPLCNIQPRGNIPVVIDSEATFVVLLIMLGISNGYVSTVCITNGLDRLSKESGGRLMEAGGALVGFFISLGLFSGACFSFVVEAVL